VCRSTFAAPDTLRRQIRQIAASTDRPFCVNLVLAFDQHDRLEVLIEEDVPVLSFRRRLARSSPSRHSQ